MRAAAFIAVLAAGTATAAESGPPAVPPPPPTLSGARDAATPALMPAAGTLCVPAEAGSLRGRLQGAIAADLDWHPPQPQCRGGLRPEGDGLRLIYRGNTPEAGPLLVVLGAGPLRPGQSARHVPVNLTLVREGSGEFFATRGDDKCAFDEVRQSPSGTAPGTYRLEGRGYCTQPARTVDGTRAVLLSTFDVTAIVEAAGADEAPVTIPESRP
jgi:hypothetical protein